jgi:amino acid transporter
MTAVAPQSSDGSSRVTGQGELARGALGLPGVVMQSITTVAPAIGVLFTLQFIASYAGVAAPLGYFLSFLLVLALASNVSQLARHLPNAGGFFTYISRSVHPRVGWLSGWIMVLYMPAATFTSPIFLCVLLQGEIADSALGVDVPWWVIFVAITGLVLTLMYRGVTISARALLILGLAEIAIVLLLSVWGIVSPGPGGLNLESFDPGNTSSHGLWFAVVFSVFALTGWESAAPLAEETANPRTNVPRALIGSVLIMGVLFTVCAWGLVLGWGTDDIDGLVGSETLPAFVLAKDAWGPLWWAVPLALLNSAIAVSIASMNVSTRMWFSMARAGALPAGLARLHPRHNTPVGALALQAAITLGFGLVLGAWWGGSDLFFVSGLLFTLAASWLYVWANVGVIRFYRRERRAEFNPWLHLVFPLLTTAALAYVCWQTFTNPAPEGRGAWALPIFLVWAGVGIAILVAMRVRGREAWLLRAGEAVHDS